MMANPDTVYLYCLVNPGSERLLKEEVAAKYPHLHFAYSRAGFVTFKNTAPAVKITVEFELDLIFARRYGPCLGKTGAKDLKARLAELPADLKVLQCRLTPEGVEAANRMPVPEYGLAAEVIELGPDEFWLGLFKSRRPGWGEPGAHPGLEKPAAAPSRAWIKLEEAFRWSGWKPGKRPTAVELGAAPGGACYSLLERGFRVWGVDAAQMSPVCTDHPDFKHIALQMHRLQSSDLPPVVDLLLCDVNLAPAEVLPQIKKILGLRPQTARFFYTLKLGRAMDYKLLTAALGQVKALGFDRLRVTQLPSNHSEIFVWAERSRLG